MDGAILKKNASESVETAIEMGAAAGVAIAVAAGGPGAVVPAVIATKALVKKLSSSCKGLISQHRIKRGEQALDALLQALTDLHLEEGKTVEEAGYELNELMKDERVIEQIEKNILEIVDCESKVARRVIILLGSHYLYNRKPRELFFIQIVAALRQISEEEIAAFYNLLTMLKKAYEDMVTRSDIRDIKVSYNAAKKLLFVRYSKPEKESPEKDREHAESDVVANGQRLTALLQQNGLASPVSAFGTLLFLISNKDLLGIVSLKKLFEVALAS